MTAAFEKGQKILIEPVRDPKQSPRDSSLEPYSGKIGTIVNVYWIDMNANTSNLYIYTVRIDNDGKEIVLHEDEISPCL